MSAEYRPIAEFDGYVVSADRVVWSVGRTVETKGGATRVTAAKQLKPDEKGRVALRRDGKTYKVRVDDLALQAFPPARVWHFPIERLVQLKCRHCNRDYRDFAMWWCENIPTIWPDRYVCPHCYNDGTERLRRDLGRRHPPPWPERPRPRPRDWSDVTLPNHFPTPSQG